jgi:putative aminopeptidase FrvX
MSVPLGAVREVDAVNVVGLLRAGDDAGSSRALMVGGHLDGLGTDPDGVVFPGANDNASGVAIVIEAARALAAKRAQLKHSIVFVAFGGEEEGYLGSAAYVQKMASVPGRVESLIAFLNADAAACCGDKLGASGEDPALQARLRAAIERHHIPYAPVSGGSDQASLARAHVPASLVQWDQPLLHTPADLVGRIDERHLRGPGEVIGEVALELASAK